ncbi:site-specific DNA-methyltransferase [Streptococcus uberis]|uniref:site-specific DNA-methyltransferase n=1 Tax=Streptococcus uberis TaxID=1349 RepID=UPI000DFAE5C4|nr:site-specific DNA-methyltransferase [Streptococcus uberis]SUO88972.1 adenine specific DNA methylase Mod [Streptococcus uberis]
MSKSTETLIQKELRQVVESFGDLYVFDGQLKKDAIINALDNYNIELISAITLNKTLSKAFTSKINDIKVIKLNDIVQILESDQYWINSFTKYTNKIGLTSHNRFLEENADVVLDFPYKDTLLKAGMSKEEVSREESSESFLNEIIAQDEIDVLLDKKIFINVKKYSDSGIENTNSITNNDNLIIKGNNLIALHSLKERFIDKSTGEGKVKLIYLDPPYNTDSKNFPYNDSFNHSTWLTFMKNRLEIAKELLSDDGLIWVQTDDREVNYLGVLLDEIFGRNNFVNLVTVKTKIGGVSGSSEGKSLRDATEFIQVYAKNKNNINLKPIFATTPVWNYIQTEYIEPGKSWKYTSVLVELGDKVLIKNDNKNNRKYYHYPNAKTCSVRQYAVDHKMTEEEVYNSIPDKIIRSTNAQSSIRKSVIDETIDFNSGFVSIEYIPIKGKNRGQEIEILYTSTKQMVMFLSDMLIEDKDGNLLYKEKLTTLWDNIQYNNLSKEGLVDFPNGKKPEKLLKNIIEMSTDEGDLVLDFFGGSGSTAATCHKLNRQYISVEQIESQLKKTIERLTSVIDARDDKGISKEVDWQGGGSFIYAELMDKNSTFINAVLNSKNSIELKKIFEKMRMTLDFDFRVELKEVSETIWSQDFELQKKILVKIIDKNQLYHIYSEIDDETVKSQLTQAEYEFNKKFYED